MVEHRLRRVGPRDTSNDFRRNRDGEPEGASLDDLLQSGIRIVRRRWALAVVVLLLFTVPATIYVQRKPDRYQATARILIEQGEEANSVMDQLRATGPAPDEFQTQSKLLRSRPVIAKAIAAARLWETPEFEPGTPLANPTEAQLSESGLVDIFLEHLSIVPQQGTHILDVTFRSSQPDVAMNGANALVQAFIDDQSTAQFAASAEVVDWLNQRLAEQRVRLEQSEGALQAYAEDQKSVSLQDRQNIIVQKLGDLNIAVTRAKTERMGKQTLYEQLRSVQSADSSNADSSLDTLPVVLSNGVLQQLRAQHAELKQKELILSQDLGDRHPDLLKLRSEIDLAETRLRAELAKVVESVRNDYQAAEALEQSLARALEEQKQEVMGLSRQSVEYGSLLRQAESDRQLYQRLLGEAQARGIAGKTVERKIRVVEPAELPRGPVGPQRMRELGLVLFGGLFLALSAPFIRESLDHRVKTPAEIEKRLGLKCLAMVPTVKSDNATGPLFTNDANAFNEAFRRIRTAALLVSTDSSAVRLMVTSAAPHEGKTVVAVNLALALAQLNQRVLLVDGDLRRPKVHKMLGIEPFPGLADVLSGEGTVQEHVRASHVPNLFVLPCGMKQRSTSELLSTAGLKRFLDELDEVYDWVVVDSPPTGAVADATVIGRMVHQTLVVLSADLTPMAAGKAMVEQLEAADVPIMGAVLNRVDLQKSAYYYTPYYTGSYSDYYSKPAAVRTRKGASDESVEAASL